MTSPPPLRPLVVFLHSDRYDRVLQAVGLLLTAASMGRPCHLFLFYGALATYLDGAWSDHAALGLDAASASAREALERGFELSDSPTPDRILEMARNEAGGVEVCACSASLQALGREPAAARGRVDRVIGNATMLEIAEGADILYI